MMGARQTERLGYRLECGCRLGRHHPRLRYRGSDERHRHRAGRGGLAAGVLCFLASAKLKRNLGYDDALDVFGVHAVGGIVGAMLTGVFASAALGGIGYDTALATAGINGTTMGEQVLRQAIGVGTTLIYTVIASLIILKLVDWTIGLRVSDEQETEGLDLAPHDERDYIL